MCAFVADNSSFAHVFPARLELRFDQHDNLTVAPVLRRFWERSGDHRRKNQRGRDEGDVDGDELDVFSQRGSRQIAGVGLFQQTHARILAQFEIHLPIAGIHGDHALRAALEQALPRLREMFASQGLTLADSGVSREPPRNQSKTSSSQGVAAVAAVGGTEIPSSPATRLSLGLVDTYA